MASEKNTTVTIKGIRDGLLVTLSTIPTYPDLREALVQELEKKQGFLRGSRVAMEVGGRVLTHNQLTQLQELFAQRGMALWAVLSNREGTRDVARDLGLATRLPGSSMDLQGNGRPEPVVESGRPQPISLAKALLLKETLRSGRAIYHEGDVIVVGDVNAGAEVVADGDIVVWGKVRGLVHAGAMGDRTAVVHALDLAPTQLRIADQIAITPPASKRRVPVPETAVIRDEQIVAEAWK